MKFKFLKMISFIVGALGLIIPMLFLNGCSKTGVVEEPYIDPHIIFTSRRWWNYDIFIADVYGGHMTHLTKNKWLDFSPAASPDGSKLAFVSDRDGNREIYILDLKWMDGYTQWEGVNLTNISKTSGHDWTPQFSPSNDKIVYTTYFPDSDNYDVFIMNIDGSGKKNITNSPGYEKNPQFSPEGSFILYQSWEKGKMEIFFSNLLDENNINLTRNTSSYDIISAGNAISPDGQKVVFTSDRDKNKNIYIMNTDGTGQKQLTSHPSNDYEPVFSPDGLSIVFTSERDGNKQVYIMNQEGKNMANLSKNSADDWAPKYYSDNRKIVFQSHRDGNWEIYMMKLDGTGQTNLTNHPRTDYSFTVLPLKNP